MFNIHSSWILGGADKVRWMPAASKLYIFAVILGRLSDAINTSQFKEACVLFLKTFLMCTFCKSKIEARDHTFTESAFSKRFGKNYWEGISFTGRLETRIKSWIDREMLEYTKERLELKMTSCKNVNDTSQSRVFCCLWRVLKIVPILYITECGHQEDTGR